MAKETKIGLALCVLLVGAFAFVVYSKMNKQKGLDDGFVAATETASDDAAPSEGDADSENFGGEPGHNHGHDHGDDRERTANSFDVPPRRRQERRSDFEQISDLKKDHQSEYGADEWDSGNSRSARRDDPFSQASHSHTHEDDEPEFGLDDNDSRNSRAEEQPKQKSWNIADLLGGRRRDESAQQQTAEDDEEEPFGLGPAESEQAGTYQQQQQQDDEFNPFAEADQSGNSRRETNQQSAGRSEFDSHQHNHSHDFGDEQEADDWSSNRSGDYANTQQSESSDWGSTTRVQRSDDFGSFDESPQEDAGDYSDEEFSNLGPAPEPGTSPQQEQYGQQDSFEDDEFSQPFGDGGGQTYRQPDHLLPQTAEVPANIGDDRPTVYVVQQGDNFWDISRKQYGAGRYYKALASYNQRRIPDPRRLRIGMKVLVPATQTLESSFPSLCPWRTAKPVGGKETVVSSDRTPGFFTNANGTPLYRVGAEDTLTAIAKSHLGRASRWVQVYALNRDSISDPAKLKIGTVLQLPSDASRVQLVRRSQDFR
jgi:nucleoid-associated protein YgaU